MAAPALRRALSSLDALKEPRFRRVWYAAMVSATGDWMQITGRAYLVFASTGSPSALGIVYFFSYVPQVLFSLFGGALADLVDRRTIVVVGNAAQGLVAVALGVLAATGQASVVNVAALSFLAGSAQTMTIAPTMALLPSLVPRAQLTSAMSLNGTTYSASRVFGPLLAGAIIPLWGVEWVFHVNAVSFCFVVVAWLLTPMAARVPERSGTFAAIAEGLRHLRAVPTVRLPVVWLGLIGLIGFSYQPLAVAYATDVLAAGDEVLGSRYYGLVQGAMGVGAIVGIVVLIELGKRSAHLTVVGAVVGFGLSLVALGLTRTPAVAIGVAVLVAGLHMGAAVLLQTLIQHEVSEELRGRTMALAMLAWIGSIPFAGFLWGQVAAVLTVPATFVLSGLLSVVVALALWPWRRFLRLVEQPGPGVEEPVR